MSQQGDERSVLQVAGAVKRGRGERRESSGTRGPTCRCHLRLTCPAVSPSALTAAADNGSVASTASKSDSCRYFPPADSASDAVGDSHVVKFRPTSNGDADNVSSWSWLIVHVREKWQCLGMRLTEVRV